MSAVLLAIVTNVVSSAIWHLIMRYKVTIKIEKRDPR